MHEKPIWLTKTKKSYIQISFKGINKSVNMPYIHLFIWIFTDPGESVCPADVMAAPTFAIQKQASAQYVQMSKWKIFLFCRKT